MFNVGSFSKVIERLFKDQEIQEWQTVDGWLACGLQPGRYILYNMKEVADGWKITGI
jgi:hypothetical protein